MSGRSAGMVLLGIIALGGLGLSGYMFLKYEFLSPTNDSELILVGLWDNLNENTDYAPYDSGDDFLLSLNQISLNDSNYVSVSSGNTRFVLKQAGLYKITLNVLFQTIENGSLYFVYLRKNGNIERLMARIVIWGNPSPTNYYAKSSLYVNSNGKDYFEINCKSYYGLPFSVSGSNQYNQLSIEYVL